MMIQKSRFYLNKKQLHVSIYETYYRLGDNMKLSELFSWCLSADYISLDGSVDVAVMKKNGALYIFFEDSDGANDWRINLDFPAVFYPSVGVYAHRGFLRSWKIAEEYLRDIIESARGEIVCAGYSHGGALALLCHGHIWQKRPELRAFLTSYGFGAPRVLWGTQNDKTEKIWKNYTVIRNINDAVTHLPPKSFGYFHVGELIEIGQVGKYGTFEAHKSENILKELISYEETDRTVS